MTSINGKSGEPEKTPVSKYRLIFRNPSYSTGQPENTVFNSSYEIHQNPEQSDARAYRTVNL